MEGSPSIDRPIFIVGCGRSGTTITYDLLAEHPALAWFSNYTQRWPAAPQLAALSRLRKLESVRRSRSRFTPKPREGHSIWDRYSTHSGSVLNAPLTEIHATEREIGRLRHVVSQHLRYQRKTRFVNKNTRNTRRIRYLRRIFEDALFIHLVRDPRAAAASLLRVHFWPELPIWWCADQTPTELVAQGRDPAGLAAEFWVRETQQVVEDRASLAPDHYLEIRYEDFVNGPAAALSVIADFADLAASPLMEALAANEVRDRTEGYRKELSAEQIQEIERIVHPHARQFGYDLAPASV
jgi:hypothetical protein